MRNFLASYRLGLKDLGQAWLSCGYRYLKLSIPSTLHCAHSFVYRPSMDFQQLLLPCLCGKKNEKKKVLDLNPFQEFCLLLALKVEHRTKKYFCTEH